MRSRRPAATARTSAAHSTSSSRDVANRRPREVRPSACPERPMRCRNVVTARGEPIWHTRSTEPTSMPSSSDAVATMARMSPALRRCSVCRRRSLARLPWWAPTRSAPEALAEVVRHALGHAARVDEDQRGAVRAHRAPRGGRRSRSTARWCDGLQVRGRQLDGQIEIAPVPDVDDRAGTARAHQEPRGLLDGVHRGRQADALRTAARRRRRGARARARGGCRACRASGRAARRRSPCRTRCSSARVRSAVSIRYSDSGVVTRMCGARFTMAARAAGVVSPVRSAVRDRGRRAAPAPAPPPRMPSERQLEVLVDVAAQRLEGRDVDDVDAVAELAFAPRGARAGRGPTGRPRASCRTRWARR